MGVEEETREFFVRIANSLAMLILWMIANVYAGFYHELAFFNGWPALKNIIYYLCLLISLYFLIRYFRKKWKF